MTRSLTVHLLLLVSGLAVGILIAFSLGWLHVQIDRGVLGLLTGFALMWFLDLAWTFVRQRTETEVLPVTLAVNRELLATEVALAEKEIFGRADLAVGEYVPSQRLLTADPALALAQTRIQLERSLRSLAERTDTPIAQRAGIRKLIEALMYRELLPPVMVGIVNEIAEVCNKAIHGYAVDRDTADVVVETGERLVRLIDTLHSGDMRSR